MALMMEPGRTEPLNEEEDADMAAIEAIRESAVTELKVVLAPQSQFLAAVISWSPEIEATRLGSLNMEHIVIRDSVGAGFGRTPPFLIMGVHGNLHGSESGGCYGTESFREFGEFVVVFVILSVKPSQCAVQQSPDSILKSVLSNTDSLW